MKKYILLYSDKKLEDNICLTNMFKNNKKINLGWTDFDYNNNMKVINEEIGKGVKQIIGLGKVTSDYFYDDKRDEFFHLRVDGKELENLANFITD